MRKLELLTVLHSLKELHEAGRPDSALKVINAIIDEARGNAKKDSTKDSKTK
ncbi:MAG: hypothetical protein FWF77_07070 [Defluviitaleaceae bacterium]|nr:hypothetical protein [Defluviitaleaceae bacterium]